MLSRWNMTERGSRNHGLLQVQDAFLELPEMPAQGPERPGAELWAWLFAVSTIAPLEQAESLGKR